MLEFHKVSDIDDILTIKKYVLDSQTGFSSLNTTGFFMYMSWFPREYCIYNNTLIVREHNNEAEVESYFYPPMGGDVQGALAELEKFCLEERIPFVLANLTSEEADKLCTRYPFATTSYNRNWSDYVYLAHDLKTFAGKKYSGQRNHINKFVSLYGEPEYHYITRDNLCLVEEFMHGLGGKRAFSSEDARKEFDMSTAVLGHFDTLGLCGGYVTVGDTIVAMALGEKRGDTLFVTVEKADYDYRGSYQVMVREFARHNATEEIVYINREEDMGIEGLRTSKLQYQPIDIRHKYFVHAHTLFHRLTPPVRFWGKKVVIDDITPSDGDDFKALCGDVQNNRYWGYDYNEDSNYEDTREYYLNFIATLKNIQEEYSLAIRLEDKLIGEIVYYNFGFDGSVEIGIRLSGDYHGMGIGKDAFVAAVEYAASLGAQRIKARCMKENKVSLSVLSAALDRISEDDKYIYLEKIPGRKIQG